MDKKVRFMILFFVPMILVVIFGLLIGIDNKVSICMYIVLNAIFTYFIGGNKPAQTTYSPRWHMPFGIVIAILSLAGMLWVKNNRSSDSDVMLLLTLLCLICTISIVYVISLIVLCVEQKK